MWWDSEGLSRLTCPYLVSCFFHGVCIEEIKAVTWPSGWDGETPRAENLLAHPTSFES